MIYKKRQMVLRPTNKGISWFQKGFNGLIFQGGYIYSYDPFLSMATVNHLYILSDEEIKEGDWYMNNKVIFKSDDKFDEGNNPNQNKNNKKIIACTDSSLITGFSNKQLNSTYLPQPSQDFIKVFVEEYNAGKLIEWVDVEYEEVNVVKLTKELFDQIGSHTSMAGYPVDRKEIGKLKVNPKNEISIRKIKDSWSREEVKQLLIKCCGEIYSEDGTLKGKNPADLYNWISENL